MNIFIAQIKTPFRSRGFENSVVVKKNLEAENMTA